MSNDLLRQEAINKLKRAQASKKVATKIYEDSLIECSDLGIPNTKIAKTLDVTETAVRNWLKRRRA